MIQINYDQNRPVTILPGDILIKPSVLESYPVMVIKLADLAHWEVVLLMQDIAFKSDSETGLGEFSNAFYIGSVKLVDRYEVYSYDNIWQTETESLDEAIEEVFKRSITEA
jgi:hypothetical protein